MLEVNDLFPFAFLMISPHAYHRLNQNIPEWRHVICASRHVKAMSISRNAKKMSMQAKDYLIGIKQLTTSILQQLC